VPNGRGVVPESPARDGGGRALRIVGCQARAEAEALGVGKAGPESASDLLDVAQARVDQPVLGAGDVP
jgi:hypothetical protein